MVAEARALRAEANSRLSAVLDAIELATRFEGEGVEARRRSENAKGGVHLV
jgi:hypothetical protein